MTHRLPSQLGGTRMSQTALLPMMYSDLDGMSSTLMRSSVDFWTLRTNAPHPSISTIEANQRASLRANSYTEQTAACSKIRGAAGVGTCIRGGFEETTQNRTKINIAAYALWETCLPRAQTPALLPCTALPSRTIASPFTGDVSRTNSPRIAFPSAHVVRT